MNEQEVIDYSVYVGIDWADKKHDVCICPRDSDTPEFDVIRHCAEDIDAWVKGLHQRYEGRIAVAVELSKEAAFGPDCVKTRHEIQFLKFDRAGCTVSHDCLSGKGRGIPSLGNISSFHTAWASNGH